MPKNKTVLIVEDEKPLTLALTTKLTKEGFDVSAASNGKEALQELEGSTFDVVIMDLVMPGMDGFGLLTAMNEKGIKLPTIVLSNLSQESDEKKAIELGAAMFLVKSDTPLVKIVQKVQELVS